MKVLESSAAEMARGIRNGDFLARDIIAAALKRAEIVQSQYNAFTFIDKLGALAAADAIDQSRASGEILPPLAGVPVAIKDMTPTRGLPTTMGSWTMEGRMDDEDAEIVARLRAAGTIIIGKTTTSEFAFSSFTRSRRYGATLNPWNPRRTAGGSSGGSAVAVATNVVPFAEGTDMGGSVRIPAAACGVVGFKPSLGRIPMTILPTPIDTISHFGPLAASVADAIAFVSIAAGPSDLDLLSQVSEFDTASCEPASISGLRFAYSTDLGYCDVAPDVVANLKEAIKKLRAAGAIVEEVGIHWTRAVMDEWLTKWSALLSMFPNGHTEENQEKMDPNLVVLINRSAKLTADDLKKTEALQHSMAVDLGNIMKRFDGFLCPTNAVSAPDAMANDVDYETTLPSGKTRVFDMAHPFNMLPTFPVLSMPIGLSSDGLPVGMQIVGHRYCDEKLLSIAGAVEIVLGSPLHAPPQTLNNLSNEV